MHDYSRRIGAVVIILALMLAVGCSRVNKENYDKISLGMAYSEVVAVLGEPDQSRNVLGGNSCTWGSDAKSINVKFVADKVVFFSANGLE